MRTRILLFNKPYGVLTQFTDADDRPTLARYIGIKGVYPAGRLDRDSEGLVVLTNSGRLQSFLTHPRHKLPKTYWVQVEGEPNAKALATLAAGVLLRDGSTAPALVRPIAPPSLWPRDPPIRFRSSIPTSWIEIVLTEGRNRQVRRMTAAIGFPTLRLVRWAIGEWTLEGLPPGAWRELSPTQVMGIEQRLPEDASRAAPRQRRRRPPASSRRY